MTRIETTLLLVLAGVVALSATLSSGRESEKSRYDWGGEGALLLSPEEGPDLSVTNLVEPGLVSVVFSDHDAARAFYLELRLEGERVCLADLSPQRPEFHGRRWWVFNC